MTSDVKIPFFRKAMAIIVIVGNLACKSQLAGGYGQDKWSTLVLCPARVRFPVRNGLVNEVKFLGLVTQNG